MAQAVAGYVYGLLSLGELQGVAPLPVWLTDSKDAMIVALSARLSIAFIPVAMIWWGASRLARWLVLAGTVIACLAMLGDPRPDAMALMRIAVTVLAVALLFTPQAQFWFDRRKADRAALRA